jgi:glyoxylase-like metal-dependent hydrolase (beta-lactamase superfamily II)
VAWRARPGALRSTLHAAELRRLGVRSGAGFAEPHDYDPEISVGLFPGHTQGYACLVRRRGGVAYFFAGHLLIRGMHGWAGAASAQLFAESLASLARVADLDLDYLMPEHTWSDAGGFDRAPLAFGPDVRAAAVASARDGLLKKAAAKRAQHR